MGKQVGALLESFLKCTARAVNIFQGLAILFLDISLFMEIYIYISSKKFFFKNLTYYPFIFLYGNLQSLRKGQVTKQGLPARRRVIPHVLQVTAALEVRVTAFLVPHVQMQRVIRGGGEDVHRILQRTPGVSGPESKQRAAGGEAHTYHPQVADGPLVVLKSLQQVATDGEEE